MCLKNLVTLPINNFSRLFGKDGDLLSLATNKYKKDDVSIGDNFW